MPEESMNDKWFPEATTNGIMADAEKLANKQQNGSPRFSFPNLSSSPSARDQLLQTLMGISAGSDKAIEASKLGSPLVAAIAGAAGAAGGARTFEEYRLHQIANTPIEQLSPDTVAAYKAQHGVDITGIPAGVINQLRPLLNDHLEAKKLAMEQAKLNSTADEKTAMVAASVLGGDYKRFIGVKDSLLQDMVKSKLQSTMPTTIIGTDGQPMTVVAGRVVKMGNPSDNKEVAKAKTALASATATESTMLPELDRIFELNKNSRGGMVGSAKQRVSSALNIGQDKPEFTNTADTINSLRGLVAKVLKSTFGGQLSDSEREYLNGVYGAVEKYTPTERAIAITNIKRMIQNKTNEARSVLKELGGTPDAGGGKHSALLDKYGAP